MDSKMPSMTALLGLLAIAGYQNRDKLAEMLKGAGATEAKPVAARSRVWAACSATWVERAPARAWEVFSAAA